MSVTPISKASHERYQYEKSLQMLHDVFDYL